MKHPVTSPTAGDFFHVTGVEMRKCYATKLASVLLCILLIGGKISSAVAAGQDAAAQPSEAEMEYTQGVTEGLFGSQDDVKAVNHFRKSAELGLAKAQTALGNAYASGQGVSEDRVEALKWYLKAAEQGDAEAQRKAGGLYVLKQDPANAYKWFRKAGEQGDADAEYWVGVSYAQGHGVAVDHTEAVKWYQKAAAQGSVEAQEALSREAASGASVAGTASQKVAYDAVAEYGIAKRNGNAMDVCVQAGMVSAAFLQAKDEENYKKWKDIERSDCHLAGVER